MLIQTLIIFMLYQFPESILMILAALCLLGLKIRLGRLFIAGLALGVVGVFSRHFLSGIGLHTPVFLISLVIALFFSGKKSLPSSIIGCFLSFFLLILGESMLMTPIAGIFKISFDSILSSPFLHIVFGLVSDGFLMIAAIICLCWRVTFIKVPESM